MASPTFLLVGLEIPEVTQVMRGIFSGYFLAIGIAGIIAMILFAAAARPVFAVGAIAIAAFAIAARRWLVQHMDAEVRARDAGTPPAWGSFASCM
jgi:hypothetical protein